MLTNEQFEALEVGQEIVASDSILPGVSPEPVKLLVTKIVAGTAAMTATWFGINMGVWTCEKGQKGLVWKTW